jgi:HSP20 family protein
MSERISSGERAERGGGMSHGGMSHSRREQNRGWHRFTELRALRAELGRVVGQALVRDGSGARDVELREADDGWVVIARLPGVAPEEVAIELDDRDLCIRARSEEEVNADHGMAGRGLRTRGFEYRMELPAPVDAGRVDAVMDHGLLTVTLPRAGRGERRTITVGRPLHAPGRTVGGTRRGQLSQPAPVDPAADRELHRPDVSSRRTGWQQPGGAAPGT